MKKGKRLFSLLCCFALTASMTLDVSAAEGLRLALSENRTQTVEDGNSEMYERTEPVSESEQAEGKADKKEDAESSEEEIKRKKAMKVKPTRKPAPKHRSP